MKTPKLCGFGLLLMVGAVANAQMAPGIRGVTRPTTNSPAPGVQGLLSLAPSSGASFGGPVIVTVFRPSLREDPSEVDRRVLAFQQKRAHDGSPGAQLDLAKRYLEGRGLTKDIEAARKWLKLSAGNGNSEAAKLLQKLPAPKRAD